jgi:hypothetical protein
LARTTATCAYPKHGPPNGIFTWLLALFILCAAGADLPVDRLAFEHSLPRRRHECAIAQRGVLWHVSSNMAARRQLLQTTTRPVVLPTTCANRAYECPRSRFALSLRTCSRHTSHAPPAGIGSLDHVGWGPIMERARKLGHSSQLWSPPPVTESCHLVNRCPTLICSCFR